jgi:hypothetical protein
MSYRRDGETVDVEFHSRGPDVELTYIQGIPLGAESIRMEGNLERGRGRQAQGPHDLQHQVTFTLTESQETRLRFQWEGGLEVFLRHAAELPPGSPTSGVRILDFTREGEGWLVTLEAESGRGTGIELRGELVEVIGAEEAGIYPLGKPGQWLLGFQLPGSGPREVKTFRLRPMPAGG